MFWHVKTSNGAFEGVMSAGDVIARIQSGRLRSDSLVKQDGTDRWLPIGDQSEFQEAVAGRAKSEYQEAIAGRAKSTSAGATVGADPPSTLSAHATIQYDPAVIREFAKALYDEADALSFRAGVRGFLLGGALAGGMSLVGFHDQTAAFVGGIVGGAVGYVIGVGGAAAQAFSLRLQAQMALCQVEIERNTGSGRI
jgi:hypothetical protein